MTLNVLVLVLIWIACGIVGWKLGESKGRPALGLVLGVVLGLIGLLVIALLPAATPRYAVDRLPSTTPRRAWAPPPPPQPPAQWVRCPSCGQTISAAVAVCGYCQGAVQPSALLPPPEGTAAGWLRDPSGRYVDRYWDGGRWTEWTRNGNDYLTDPPVPSR
jgi:hypothetical protein